MWADQGHWDPTLKSSLMTSLNLVPRQITNFPTTVIEGIIEPPMGHYKFCSDYGHNSYRLICFRDDQNTAACQQCIIKVKSHDNQDNICNGYNTIMQIHTYNPFHIVGPQCSAQVLKLCNTKHDRCEAMLVSPDSKVHGANMRPIWGRQGPGGPHVGPMNFAIWVPAV